MGNGKAGIAERSAHTQWLIAKLKDIAPGEVLTYAALSEHAGINVNGPGRNYLQSARRAVLREYGIVTDTVRTVGVKRLENSAIHGVADAAISHIRHTAKHANRKMSVADIAALPPDVRSLHLTKMAQLGVLHIATTDKYARRIDKVIGQSMQPPPLADAIAALKE